LCFFEVCLLSVSCQPPRERPENTASSLRTLLLDEDLRGCDGVAGLGSAGSDVADSVELGFGVDDVGLAGFGGVDDVEGRGTDAG